MTDAELIEWVANAKIGEAVPPEFRGDGRGQVAILERLVEAGCPIAHLRGALVSEVVPVAAAWAREQARG